MKVITLPKLQPWQEEVYKEVSTARNSGRTFVVRSKRQVGKSILAVCLLIKYGLEKKCTSICIEPTQAQSRRIFKQVCDFLQGADVISSANATLLTIEFVNGSEILFKSAEQGDNLRGFTVNNGLLVIDEAAFIQKSIFEILWSTTDSTQSPCLLISTPLFQSGVFYEKYMDGIEGNEFVKSFDWSKYDTSIFLPKAKLEYYRKTTSPLRFRSEYLGLFIQEGSYIFGDIMKCTGDYSTKPPVYCGVDWGTGDGNDYTYVVMMDEDGVVTSLWSTKNMDAVEQVDKIAQLINAHPSIKVVCVEKNSIGQVFYDMLKRKTNKRIERFLTTNDTKRKIIEQLVEAFQTDSIGIPNDDELLKELQHYNVEKTKTGYTYNGADGVNDDGVVALALCYNLCKRRANQFSIAFA